MDTYAPFAEIYEWSAPMTEDIPFTSDWPRRRTGRWSSLPSGPVESRSQVAHDRAADARDRPFSANAGEGAEGGGRAAWSSSCARGDMRELSLDEPAALIYCPYRSHRHLPTWADRRRSSNASPSP